MTKDGSAQIVNPICLGALVGHIAVPRICVDVAHHCYFIRAGTDVNVAGKDLMMVKIKLKRNLHVGFLIKFWGI